MNYELLIFLPGLVFTVLGLFNFYRALSRRKWPSVVGVIQRNDVSEITSSNYSPTRIEPLSAYSSKSSFGTDKEQVLGLSYVYVVDAGKYIGTQLFSAPIIKARQRIGGLLPGDKVKVFYKPTNPHSSFLAHSFAWPSIAFTLIGLCLAALAAYVLYIP